MYGQGLNSPESKGRPTSRKHALDDSEDNSSSTRLSENSKKRFRPEQEKVTEDKATFALADTSIERSSGHRDGDEGREEEKIGLMNGNLLKKESNKGKVGNGIEVADGPNEASEVGMVVDAENLSDTRRGNDIRGTSHEDKNPITKKNTDHHHQDNHCNQGNHYPGQFDHQYGLYHQDCLHFYHRHYHHHDGAEECRPKQRQR
jgi:hypothetical protein